LKSGIKRPKSLFGHCSNSKPERVSMAKGAKRAKVPLATDRTGQEKTAMTKPVDSDRKTEMTYGGKVVGQALKQGGVDSVFGIYGSINLAIEEANRQGVKMYHFRHEQSAGFAADAYARCLRKPGVCFSSSAPGFVNLVSPIAQAKGAMSPVVLLNGQHGTTGDGLDTIQEGYATEVMRPFAKWTHRCLDWNMHSYWVQKALTESV